MIKVIKTTDAPSAIGPYSQAILVNGMLFISGQGGIVPSEGKVIEGGITAETEQACRNIEAVLKANGMDFSNVVKTTCFLSDMNNFVAFNEVYAKNFISKPARSCVAVKEMPMGFLCEIEVIAVEK